MRRRKKNRSKPETHIEHTPNGGKIVRGGRFTFFNSAGLKHFWETDPTCREWELVNSLCDKRLLPYPGLPVYDSYNRPDYLTNPDGDTTWWTPDEALKKYGRHLNDDKSH